MKAVLISVNPIPCGRIANRIKTTEVRKSIPKLPVPFRCYIYCTKGGELLYRNKHTGNIILTSRRYRKALLRNFDEELNGKVIGEFVCDYINEWDIDPQTKKYFMTSEELNETCLSYDQLHKYGKDKILHGWHISNLVIYDKPKELSEFITICPEWEKEYFDTKCLGCKYYFSNCADMQYECTVEGEKPLTRPPQSWCYVEGKEDEGK